MHLYCYAVTVLSVVIPLRGSLCTVLLSVLYIPCTSTVHLRIPTLTLLYYPGSILFMYNIVTNPGYYGLVRLEDSSGTLVWWLSTDGLVHHVCNSDNLWGAKCSIDPVVCSSCKSVLEPHWFNLMMLYSLA